MTSWKVAVVKLAAVMVVNGGKLSGDARRSSSAVEKMKKMKEKVLEEEDGDASHRGILQP